MKKLLSIVMAMVLCLVLVSPGIAYASPTKINKSKLTLDVGDTYSLNLGNIVNEIKWSSSDKTIIKVSANGKVKALNVGKAVITAAVSSKKYICKVTVNDKVKATTYADFEDYLNKEYSSIKTVMGTMTVEHSVTETFSDTFAFDYSISSDWSGVSPYDIEYSDSYTQSEKDDTKKKLRNFQENIYKDAINSFPDKKVDGTFISSWYTYPSIQVGYNSIRFLSWSNYEDSNDIYPYKTSKIGDFRWLPEYDDYDFTN